MKELENLHFHRKIVLNKESVTIAKKTERVDEIGANQAIGSCNQNNSGIEKTINEAVAVNESRHDVIVETVICQNI